MLPPALAILCALLALPAVAAEIPKRKAKTVLILPTKRLDHDCSDLFDPAKKEEFSSRIIDETIDLAVAALDDVNVVPFAKMRGRVSGQAVYREKIVLGRERFLLGKEFYLDLRQKEAEENLGRAVEFLDAIFYDVVEPHAFAEVLLLLGVTLMEEGRAASAHQALARSLQSAPGQKVPSGYYPKPVEQALLIACEDAFHSLEREVPLGGFDRLQQFMTKFDLDTVILPVLVKEKDSRMLVLVGYDAGGRGMTFREQIPVGTEGDVREPVSRAISRWAACTPFATEKRKEGSARRSAFGASYQHLFYLQHPTRRALTAMGFSFDFAFFFRKSFGLAGRIQLMSSLADKYRDVLDGFTSGRLLLGPAFGISKRVVRFFVMPGLDLHFVGSFSTSQDPDCKFYDSGSEAYAKLCHPDEYGTTVMLGINVDVVLQLFLAKDMYLGLGANVSTYFIPTDRLGDLNFPLGIYLGGGIAF
jgi:hypothetical protein